MVLLVGVSTFVAGVILVLRHLHVWRQQTDATESPVEKKFLWAQLRRRALTSTCIAVLGFVIGLLHFREYWRDRPTSWMILICCCLILTLMIFVLASLDFLAVSHAIRREQGNAGEAARELAREYHRLKKQRDEPDQESAAEESRESSGADAGQTPS